MLLTHRIQHARTPLMSITHRIQHAQTSLLSMTGMLSCVSCVHSPTTSFMLCSSFCSLHLFIGKPCACKSSKPFGRCDELVEVEGLLTLTTDVLGHTSMCGVTKRTCRRGCPDCIQGNMSLSCLRHVLGSICSLTFGACCQITQPPSAPWLNSWSLMHHCQVR